MGITLLKSRAPSQPSLREAWMAARVARDHASFVDLSDRLLARQPDSVPIRRAMARYHAEIGAHEQAAPHWASLRDLSSSDFEATFHFAKREVATGLGIGRAVEKADRSGSETFNAYLRRVLEAPVARHDAPEDIKHVAICGVSFCGSTLLDRVLGGLPGAQSIGESHWLVKYHDGSAYVPFDLTQDEPTRMPRCTVCGRDCKHLTYQFRVDMAADFTRWYQKIAARVGTKLLFSADKNPPKLIDNDPLLRMHALVLFKSPTQAWGSQLSKMRQGGSETFYEIALEEYIDSWTRAYRVFLDDFKPRGDMAFLYFDAFAENPEPSLRAACRMLGLPDDDSLLKRTRTSHSIGGNSNAMKRLREANYAVSVTPLPAPSIPTRHRARIAAAERMQATFADLRARFEAMLV